MKAWMLENNHDSEGNVSIVFADSRGKAKTLADEEELGDFDWTSIRAVRAKYFDDMETLSHKEFMREQWHYGYSFSFGDDVLPMYDDPHYAVENFDFISREDIEGDHLRDDVFDVWYGNTYEKEAKRFALA